MKCTNHNCKCLDCPQFNILDDLVISAKNVGGRPKSPPLDMDEVIKLRTEGLTFKAIADRLDTSLAMVYREIPAEYKGRIPLEVRRRINKKKEKREGRNGRKEK